MLTAVPVQPSSAEPQSADPSAFAYVTDEDRQLGTALRLYRDEQGLSRKAVCDKVEPRGYIRVGSLTNIETGRQRVYYVQLIRICQAMDVDPCDILVRAGVSGSDKREWQTDDLLDDYGREVVQLAYNVGLRQSARRRDEARRLSAAAHQRPHVQSDGHADGHAQHDGQADGHAQHDGAARRR